MYPRRINTIKAFITLTPMGSMNFTCVEQVLTQVADAHGGLDQNILLDLHDVTETSVFSDTRVWKIVELVMMKFPNTFSHKMALLDTDASHREREEFFIHCAQARGVPVKVFATLALALEWFGEADGREADSRRIFM